MAPTALIFDLDGTIWDSYPWYAAILQQLGAMSAEDALGTLMGGSNIMRVLREARVSIATFLKVGADKANHLSLYDGVPQVLRELADRRMPMAVLSGLSASLAEPMLAKVGLGPLFRVSEFGAQKASPNAYHRIAQALNVPIGTAAYVGDMPTDALGASRAGMPFWWASYGYSKSVPTKTDRTLRSFGDILAN